MLTTTQIAEFKEIYKQEVGRELSDAQALDKATRLINLMKVVYRPIPKADLEKAQARIKQINET